MSMRDAIKARFEKDGIVLDDGELDMLLSQDDEQPEHEEIPSAEALSDLPGTAEGVMEIALDPELLSEVKVKKQPEGELFYEPIIRTGQWAMRPGPNGQKRKVPLKVVGGSTPNSKKEIGLADIVSAFKDEAIQHVTVPISHANTLLENTGFIDDLKIVKGKAKNQKTKQLEDVEILMGGYRITEPEIKARMERGTIANRSAGLLYDYTDTERGQTWPVVLEHVALTNRPWITGMQAFGRKLANKLQPLSLSLSSDAAPESDEEYLELLSEVQEDPELELLAEADATWNQDEDPEWLQQQVDQILRARRAEKIKARPKGSSYLDYEEQPYYRCKSAKPGQALISDSYGDNANYWIAPFEVEDGVLTLADLSKWSKVKKAFVSDSERADPPANLAPLSQDNPSPEPELTGIQLAQLERSQRGSQATTNPNEGGNTMSTKNDSLDLSQLDPATARVIAAMQEKLDQQSTQITNLSQENSNLRSDHQTSAADSFIALLKKPIAEGGLGLSEEAGFTGFFKTLRSQLLADDGKPALQSDNFSTDANPRGELSYSEGIRELFSTLIDAGEAFSKLGEQLSEPSGGEEGNDEDKGDKDGKTPEGTTATPPAGKPAATAPEGEETGGEGLSTDVNNEEMLSLLGIATDSKE